MRLKDAFWKQYELDLQEVKLAYLNWAISYAKEPNPDHRHLFLWEHQKDFCLIDSKYVRSPIEAVDDLDQETQRILSHDAH